MLSKLTSSTALVSLLTIFMSSARCQDASLLRGLADFKDVETSAIETPGKLLPDCRNIVLHVVEVHIKNNTDQPIIVKGVDAITSVNGQVIKAGTVPQVMASCNCGLQTYKIAAIVLATATTAGFWGPLTAEAVEPKRGLGVARETDGVRQSSEGAVMGNRLIMPGDETTGWLCFPSPEKSHIPEIQIPVMTGGTSDNIKHGQLTLVVTPSS